MTADDLTALNEQIAAMARAGLPLDQGLAGLARDLGGGKLRAVTEAIARDLRAGHPLPEALANQEGRIPAYYANLVTAGVQTGHLPEVLTTLSTYSQAVASTRATVLFALLYPTVVLVLGLGLFCLMALFILPQFKGIFQEFGLPLPWITRLVLLFGEYPVETLLLPALGFIGVVTLGWILTRYTSWGRRTWPRLVYMIPLIGNLIRAARLSAFTDLLGMLVEYEVPLPIALRLAGAASSDPVMAGRAREVEQRLAQGMPIANAFKGLGLVPEWVAWLASTGERRGGLAPALRQIANVYRRRVTTDSTVLRTVLPPLVVIATAGFLTGFFVIALMLPMIKLLDGLSK